jgi:hypothetical protein
MRSTISTIAAVAAGLFASTVSAQGQVAIYWGQGAYQRELSVVCEDPSVDIVNIAFVNGFPTSRDKYPDTNFGELMPVTPVSIQLTVIRQCLWRRHLPSPRRHTKQIPQRLPHHQQGYQNLQAKRQEGPAVSRWWISYQ